jgi:hypothetical protein
MEKSKMDRAVEVALDTLSECLRKKQGISEWYLFGYEEAISDFLWNYAGSSLAQLKVDEYNARVRRMQKIIDKIENSPIKKTKFEEVNKNERKTL